MNTELVKRAAKVIILPATFDLRQEPYVGDAHKVLYQTITKYSQANNGYARYQAVIQSSGMGKTRMIDELSKDHLVIRISLSSDEKGAHDFTHSNSFLSYYRISAWR